MLPADLHAAEAQLRQALDGALAAEPRGRWTVELRFEGLRLLPLALRLATDLRVARPELRLLFPDAGAAALAQRDAPDLAGALGSFGDERRRQRDRQAAEAAVTGDSMATPAGSVPADSVAAGVAEAGAAEPAPAADQVAAKAPVEAEAESVRPGSAEPAAANPGLGRDPGDGSGLLILVAPAQSEYSEVEALCGEHRGPVVLLNPSLEDAAVGIGSVARQRRKGFLAQWRCAYALVPQPASALRHAHPGPWELYRLDPDGFRAVASFERRPDGEEQEQVLAGGAAPGLGANLRALGDLIEGLQN